MIDAASFRENNPNYFFPSIDEKPLDGDDNSNSEEISFGNDQVVTKGKTFCLSEELILCSETAYGFCFLTK